MIHGSEDDRVPIALTADYAGAAADAGDPIVFHELEGTGHFEVLDPETAAWSVAAGEIEELITGL